jgi:hypothetical protein
MKSYLHLEFIEKNFVLTKVQANIVIVILIIRKKIAKMKSGVRYMEIVTCDLIKF